MFSLFNKWSLDISTPFWSTLCRPNLQDCKWVIQHMRDPTGMFSLVWRSSLSWKQKSNSCQFCDSYSGPELFVAFIIGFEKHLWYPLQTPAWSAMKHSCITQLFDSSHIQRLHFSGQVPAAAAWLPSHSAHQHRESSVPIQRAAIHYSKKYLCISFMSWIVSYLLGDWNKQPPQQ